ncbi:sugar transferase [Sphingomonas sp. LM7]|nr:sugar transferase [Sphingomonas sp. LM7]
MSLPRERSSPVTRRFVTSLTFQGLGILIASAVIPLCVALVVQGQLPNRLSILWNSEIASLLSAVTALLIFRKVTSYPGTNDFAYIIPAFSVTYGIAVVVLLGLRLSYSGAMLSAGYVATIIFSFIATQLTQRFGRHHFYVVPFGQTQIVEDAPAYEWIVLSEPTLPEGDRHGAIVADLRCDLDPEWERMLAEAAIAGRPVYHTKQLRESLTGRVEIEHLSENSFGSLLPNLAYRKIKRGSDILFTLLALPLVALPMLLVAVLIRFDSPGPVLFRQVRMGHRARPFHVYKFRTMTHREIAHDGDEARNDAITMAEDHRITRLGRFLRRSRMDELPQLFNVLRGEMSLIGPRPEAIPLSQWYESELPFYSYRHIVRPGITGWAQVNQGHVAELHEAHLKLHYDFYYIKHFSAWLDTLIAFRTIGVILNGFGSK